MLCIIPDIDAVYRYASGGNIVESRDKVDKRGLSASGASDYRSRPAALCSEIYVFKHICIGITVSEINVVEANGSVGYLSAGLCCFSVLNGRLAGEHLIDTLCGNGSSGQEHGYHSQHQKRHYYHHSVCYERHHTAHLKLADIYLICSDPHDKYRHAIHHKRHCGEHKAHYHRICKVLV